MLADRFNWLLMLAVLFCAVVLLFVLDTFDVLTEPAPLVLLEAVICPSGPILNCVPGVPAKFSPPGAPINCPIHVPALLISTSQNAPPFILELAIFRILASTVVWPVFIVVLPLVLAFEILSPVLVFKTSSLLIFASLFWKVLLATVESTDALLVEFVPLLVFDAAASAPATGLVVKSGKIMSPSRVP